MSTPSDRQRLMETLYQKYSRAHSYRSRLTYWRKKYSWLLVVTGSRAFKRLIDMIGALALLLLLSPLMLVVALIIKISDGGPVLYVSKRVGRHGMEFWFPKFRSMIPNADKQKEALQSDEDIRFKLKRDPRVTVFGALIRRLSIDELPQLWCVLKGEMSLVGPRPPLPEEVRRYNLAQRQRLEIKPGLTCLWQVSGRSEVPFQQQVQLDVEYIESQSLWLDFTILLKTIPAVILGRGAY